MATETWAVSWNFRRWFPIYLCSPRTCRCHSSKSQPDASRIQYAVYLSWSIQGLSRYLLHVVKLSEPLLRIELEETSCWSLDWANSELIAVGCTNGQFHVACIIPIC